MRGVDVVEPGRVGVGAHELQRRAVRHPLGVRDRAGERDAGGRARSAAAAAARGAARGRAAARAARLGASGCAHSPAGAIAVTDAPRPASASSSATQPPSELPATCGRSTPSVGSAPTRRRGRRARRARRRARRLAEARACRPRTRRARPPGARSPGPTCGGRCRGRAGARAAGRCPSRRSRIKCVAAATRARQRGRAAGDGRGLRRRAVGGCRCGPTNVAAMSVRSPAMLRDQPRAQRRAAHRGGDARSRAARSRAPPRPRSGDLGGVAAPRARARTRAIRSGAAIERRAVGDAQPETTATAARALIALTARRPTRRARRRLGGRQVPAPARLASTICTLPIRRSANPASHKHRYSRQSRWKRSS